ncbi:pentatricopeptide repeat-containing protein At2g39620 [Magnolia sinica]|uniref:pentatricopeptide repeat-containing protein At2g39620 n=1 Tax=Magnolia sinica TaxID=86752 RepID=UPI00265A61ED|nr:pentatricopeptide repeat-containing protein At2g39620 [Magnolia sinica]
MIKHAVSRPFHSLAVTDLEIPRLHSHKPAIFHNYPQLLRSCKDINALLQIHAHLLVSGLESDDFILAQLVNSYSSFRKSDLSRAVFDSVVNPSGILWNSMIRAYTRTNHHRNAIELYHEMVKRGVEPDKYTFTFFLKACTGASDLEGGVLIHREIVRKGLECDVFVGTALIDMYSKLGQLKIARELFERMPELDVVAWNAMIAGFSQSVDPIEALGFFRKMQSACVGPNSVSLLNLFPAICRISALPLCRAVHGFVVRRDFPLSIYNGLIDMYSKCGNVEVGRRVFDRMLDQDDVSWGTIISSYAHNGYFFEALELFNDLKRECVMVNQVAAVSALSAAAEMRDLEKGMDVHTYLIKRGIDVDILATTTLITMYAKCGNLEEGKRLFDGITERDTVAWSAMISAFVQSEHPEEGMALFREMQSAKIRPNRVTIVSVLPACADISYLNLGRSIHCYVLKSDLGFDVSTGTALVAMYAKCGSFNKANALFDKLPQKDVVTWNALINGYAQIGDACNAMKMFHQLQSAGLRPDSGTMVGVLPACVLLGAHDQGMCVHGKIIKSGFESDLHVKNAIMDMYAKCGSLSSAEFLFDEIVSNKDEISWNIMIAGYTQNGRAKDAISAFHQMRAESLQPNLVTIVSVLPAAAFLAALREGMALHSYVIRTGFESNVLVGNSLIDMYAKCGRLDFSKKFFDGMDGRDIVSWNAMLSGYAVHGHGEDAVSLFTKIQEDCMEVDSVSFISVLSACRHGGLIDEGRKIFNAMSSVYHLEPDLEHYACMVDLLGRAGRLDEAWRFIQMMPMAPDAGVWGALLGACRMHSNLKLGEMALEHLVQLEPQNPAHYVVLSNIYAQVGNWAKVGKMRSMMNGSGLKKTPGCSWVEIKDAIHAFRVGDQSHPQLESICMLWRDWNEKMEKMGYVPDTSCVLQNVEEEEKEFFLYTHSERLAIAYAVLNTESGATIQIVKNLRVCGDCHAVTKFVSKITGRGIIVRDASRFHHFENGTCSCKDYW